MGKLNQMSFHLDSPFYADSKRLFTPAELDELLVDDHKFFVEYVEKYWLERYHMMKRTSKTLHVPSIIAQISDMPSGGGDSRKSNTENYALKSITAEEWVNVFDESVERLPRELRDLITTKYLNRRSDGNAYEDDYVYDSLNISRTKYYEMKPRALEELGRVLFSLTSQQ